MSSSRKIVSIKKSLLVDIPGALALILFGRQKQVSKLKGIGHLSHALRAVVGYFHLPSPVPCDRKAARPTLTLGSPTLQHDLMLVPMPFSCGGPAPGLGPLQGAPPCPGRYRSLETLRDQSLLPTQPRCRGPCRGRSAPHPSRLLAAAATVGWIRNTLQPAPLRLRGEIGTRSASPA